MGLTRCHFCFLIEHQVTEILLFQQLETIPGSPVSQLCCINRVYIVILPKLACIDWILKKGGGEAGVGVGELS